MHQESCAEPQSLPKAGIVAVLLHCHELHSIIALLGYAGEDMICHSNQKSECCRDYAAKLTKRWCHTSNIELVQFWGTVTFEVCVRCDSWLF